MSLLQNCALFITVTITLLLLRSHDGGVHAIDSSSEIKNSDAQSAAAPYVLYEWLTPIYDWQDSAQEERYRTELLYIPANNAITGKKKIPSKLFRSLPILSGIKVWQNNVYVTVPRWRPGWFAMKCIRYLICY